MQDMLLDYASGIASEISKARDKLRKSGENMTDSAQDEAWPKLKGRCTLSHRLMLDLKIRLNHVPSKLARVANTSPLQLEL